MYRAALSPRIQRNLKCVGGCLNVVMQSSDSTDIRKVDGVKETFNMLKNSHALIRSASRILSPAR